MFTLYVIPGGDGQLKERDVTRAIDSFCGIAKYVHVVRGVYEVKHTLSVPTPYYGVIHSDEAISVDLCDALMGYMLGMCYDVLVLFRKTFDWNRGKDRVFRCPRIFSQRVKLKSNSLCPTDPINLTTHVCSDGWVYDIHNQNPKDSWQFYTKNDNSERKEEYVKMFGEGMPISTA